MKPRKNDMVWKFKYSKMLAEEFPFKFPTRDTRVNILLISEELGSLVRVQLYEETENSLWGEV